MIGLGIALATLAAFVISVVFYSVAPAAGSTTVAAEATTEPASGERPRPGQIAIELARSAIVSGLVAGLLLSAGWGGPGQGALLGLALWALPVVLLAGSVLWEKVPVRSAVLHAGDWLIKLVAIGVIVGLFT